MYKMIRLFEPYSFQSFNLPLFRSLSLFRSFSKIFICLFHIHFLYLQSNVHGKLSIDILPCVQNFRFHKRFSFSRLVNNNMEENIFCHMTNHHYFRMMFSSKYAHEHNISMLLPSSWIRILANLLHSSVYKNMFSIDYFLSRSIFSMNGRYRRLSSTSSPHSLSLYLRLSFRSCPCYSKILCTTVSRHRHFWPTISIGKCPRKIQFISFNLLFHCRI